MKDFSSPVLVDLKLPKEGFRSFISSWIYEVESKLMIVDPGPTNSLGILIEELEGRIPDLVLLTHIHIDHAGGLGKLCELYPKLKVICYERAHRHLIDPSQLIVGSREVAGDLMDVYGDIGPVEEARLIKADSVHKVLPDLEIIATPGHASHHISFKLGDLVFCGEALGIRFDLPNDLYIRPATPPPFKLEVYKDSIRRLKGYRGELLMFAHYGQVKWEESYFELALNQIDLWIEIVKGKKNFNDIFEELLIRDDLFKNFIFLPKDIQLREKIFIGNTISGIFGMLSA